MELIGQTDKLEFWWLDDIYGLKVLNKENGDDVFFTSEEIEQLESIVAAYKKGLRKTKK